MDDRKPFPSLRNGHKLTSMFGRICRIMTRQAKAMKYAYNCLTAWASPRASCWPHNARGDAWAAKSLGLTCIYLV
ncbi:hypothetical protein LF1_50230 [Rubripirellula obstinata]|uniref:Uncharacterized protein n=1 Tax=Rubripirellula obstinata TaxID=406547 RepID=A0A5B1CRG3_9BACT|nr:hypothetical protein LF1_50230 [Rubripirellula obstinata]